MSKIPNYPFNPAVPKIIPNRDWKIEVRTEWWLFLYNYTPTHQVAIVGVDPVGGVLEGWELLGVLRKKGLTLVPLVGGRRRAHFVGAPEDGLPVGGHRGRDVAYWGLYRNWGHTNTQAHNIRFGPYAPGTEEDLIPMPYAWSRSFECMSRRR